MSEIARQVRKFDMKTGEVLSDSLIYGSSNGGGWVIMYTDKVFKLLKECPSGATIRIFVFLSMGQGFDNRGMSTTKKYVADQLGITKKTCLESFKWLKEHFIISETKINGQTEFMVNPDYVTVGRDKKARQAEWIRRWSGDTISIPAKIGRKREIVG